VFLEVAAAVRAEVAAAREALSRWQNLAPTPLLLGLGEILQAQVDGLRRRA
jgi:hypothetical protein